MSTHFTLQSLDVGGLTFWFDGNSKITLNNGSFDFPRANAFSLVEIEDCPGATPLCRALCYVTRMQHDPVHEAYKVNSANIRKVLGTSLESLTVVAFADWLQRYTHWGFRWHVSGDIFSAAYANFIRRVCQTASEVPSWLYTRSFQFVKHLVACPNLVVNLSADADNYEDALAAHTEFGFRICYLSTQVGDLPMLPSRSTIFPDHSLRGCNLADPQEAPWWKQLTPDQRKMVCPADFFGQSRWLRCGPCKKCLRHNYH